MNIPSLGGKWVRILIKTACGEDTNLPYNYHLQLNNCIKFALVTGISELEKSDQCQDNHLKTLKNVIIEKQNYTYSKFNFFPKNLSDNGFQSIQRGEILFSCPLPDSYFKYFIKIFKLKKLNFFYNGETFVFTANFIYKIKEPEIHNQMRFITKSPIAACKCWIGKYNSVRKHFYNYLREKERYRYITKVKESLLEKYELCHGEPFDGDSHLYLKFDKNYINNYNGKISKLIHFENNEKIKAFEAPFFVEADSRLIKVGFQCGFGHESHRGFGCVDINFEYEEKMYAQEESNP